jgi:hypothetical protein
VQETVASDGCAVRQGAGRTPCCGTHTHAHGRTPGGQSHGVLESG